MNEKQEIESVLQGWKPRKPSPHIHEQLFGIRRQVQAAEAAAETPAGQFAFRWLLPATAGLLLLCLVANSGGGRGLASSTNSGPMVAMILSNQSAIAYLPGSFKTEQNNVPRDTFEWTNVNGSTSSIRSLSTPKESD
jgi:hypothetical protein